MSRTCAPQCRDRVSYQTFSNWRRDLRRYDAISAVLSRAVYVTTSRAREDEFGVTAARTSSEMFAMLGVKALEGRHLLPTDTSAGASNIAVLGHRLARRLFADPRNAVGETIMLDGRPVTVVGVMPAQFRYPGWAELWVPLTTQPTGAAVNVPAVTVLAHLAPGVTVDQARQELSLRAGSDGHTQPSEPARIGAVALLGADDVAESSTLLPLFGLVAGVFLIGLANVVGIHLVRTLSRRHEIAIRIALGARVGNLVAMALSEAFMISLASFAIAVLVFIWGSDVATALVEQYYGLRITLSPRPAVVGIALLTMLVVALILAAVPLSHAGQTRLERSIREGGAAHSASKGGVRARQALIVLEVSAAFVLTVAAGLFAASLRHIRQYDVGFDPENTIIAELSVRGSQATARDRLRDLARTGLERLRTLPAVEAVAVWSTTFPRKSMTSFDRLMALEGARPTLTFAAVPPIEYQVSEGFFRTLRIAVARGRPFDQNDFSAAERSAVINEEAARLWWPGQDPLGKRFKLGPAESEAAWLTVVGVVRNTHSIGSAGVFGALENPGYFPLAFTPLAQASPSALTFAVRSRNGQHSTVKLRQVLQELDPDVRVGAITRLRESMSDFGPLARVALNARMVSWFAIFGVILALGGVYAAVFETVQRRTREIGIRMALGADRVSISGSIIWSGIRIALIGVMIGLAGSVFLGATLQKLLYGVRVFDIRLILLAAGAILLTAAVASFLPARHAARLNPALALRVER